MGEQASGVYNCETATNTVAWSCGEAVVKQL